MKKILYGFTVVLAICLMAGVANAGIFEDAVNYVKERPVKAGVSYEVIDNEILASIGTAIVKGIYPNVDIDLLVSGDDKDLFNDDDKIVSLGASYNLKLTENSKLYLGASLGTKRLESLKNSETGEAKILISGLYSWKF